MKYLIYVIMYKDMDEDNVTSKRFFLEMTIPQNSIYHSAPKNLQMYHVLMKTKYFLQRFFFAFDNLLM